MVIRKHCSQYQIKTALPAPPTKGSAYSPMESGRGVDDKVRPRIKKEKKEWRKQKDQKMKVSNF
jgi:hypothetical protein